MCAVALATGCGGKKTFKVDVDVPAVGTQEMTVIYTTADGDRSVVRVPALDGKFSFEGRSGGESTVELYKANKTLFAAFNITDGENARLLADGDSLYLDGVESLITTAYADSVVTEWPKFVSPELVMGYDSINTFEPEGIWIFTVSSEERSDAVLDTIRAYVKDKKTVRDVYVSADIAQWRMFTRRDSATWTQALLPDAPLALKGILLTTPCLVEVDTAGTVSRVQRLE